MGYYVRAFCTTGEPPAIGPMLEFAKNRGSIVELEDVPGEPALDDRTWAQAGVLYKVGKAPIDFEVNRDEAGEDSLVREEVDEFLEFLEETPDSGNKERVQSHLRATKFVVAARLATNDIDHDGYTALGNLLSYFVEHNAGMIQADGEGFYDGTEVIVALG